MGYKFKSKGPLRGKLFDGWVMLPSFDVTNMRVVSDWDVPEKGFHWVVTFPKCGTTWTQMIIALLARDGAKPPLSAFGSKYFNQPFIEIQGIDGVVTDEVRPPPLAIKSHLPFELQPRSRAGTDRFLCVVRNPKDCAVSWFHHLQRLEYLYELDWDEFFDAFLDGTSGYRDYFDHLTSWWLASRDSRYAHQITFLHYEDMKQDPAGAVRQIAGFMGQDYVDKLEADPDLVGRIVEYSSFDYMKGFNDPMAVIDDYNQNKEKTKNGKPKDDKPIKPLSDGMKRILAAWEVTKQESEAMGIQLGAVQTEGHVFFRKGQVNDWQNYFTAEQSERMRVKFEKYSAMFGIDKLWTNLDWL